jgi:hypothetical protein
VIDTLWMMILGFWTGWSKEDLKEYMRDAVKLARVATKSSRGGKDNAWVKGFRRSGIR